MPQEIKMPEEVPSSASVQKYMTTLISPDPEDEPPEIKKPEEERSYDSDEDEKRPFIRPQEGMGLDKPLDASEKGEAKIYVKRLISDIKTEFTNEEKFEALFGILNTTGSYIRNLNNKATSTKKYIWDEIKAGLVELNKKQRQKLLWVCSLLQKLNIDLSVSTPENTYLNNKIHKNIKAVLSLFELDDDWFEQGEDSPLTENESIIFHERTKIALEEAYLNFRIRRDKIVFWLALIITLTGAAGVGLGAYFGCRDLLLGASASVTTAPIIAGGVPYVVIAAGLALAGLLYVFISQIGKTAGHKKLGMAIGGVMGVGALFGFVALPFIINFPLAALVPIATISILSLSFITFLVNSVILSGCTIDTLIRGFRGETLKKDNGKEMSWKKKYLVFPINFILSTIVGLAMATLFLFMSNPLLQINFLAVLGFIVCTGVCITYFSVIFETHQSCMRAPGGFWGAFEKLFKPAIDTFKNYSPAGKKIAWSITVILSIVIIAGVVYLGMTQGVSIFNLLGGNPFNIAATIAKIVGGIMGAITAISLASFYINGLAKCIGKVVEVFTNRSKVEDQSMKSRKVHFWDDNNKFSQLRNAVHGTHEDEKEGKEKQPPEKRIIITRWKQDSWIIFFAKKDVIKDIEVMENIIVSSDQEKNLFDAINTYYENLEVDKNRNILIDLIEKSYISKNRRWVRDIAKGVAYHPLLVPLNALVNASFIRGGGIRQISGNEAFVDIGIGANYFNSGTAGSAASIKPKSNGSLSRHVVKDRSHPFNRSNAENDEVNRENDPSLSPV